MKRMVLSLIIVAVVSGLAFGEDLAKNVACEAGCKKTMDECKSKAGGNKIKEAGCKSAHESCLKDCKKDKGGDKGKKVEKKEEKKKK